MSKNNLAEERLEKNSNKNERSRVSEFRHRNTLKPKNAKTEKVKPKKFNQLQKFIFTNIGWFQTLFLWILKSLDFEISTGSSDSQ